MQTYDLQQVREDIEDDKATEAVENDGQANISQAVITELVIAQSKRKRETDA